MTSSKSSITQPNKPHEQQSEKDALQKLKSTGKWATAITLLSYVYGDVTMARVTKPDPRQNSWLLMYSSYITITFTLFYIATVTWLGPLYMRNRKPISGLRPYMMAYNAFQVVFSFYIFWQAGINGWFNTYKWVCQSCDFSNSPQGIGMMHAGYWYYFSKFVDFIDTVFFVMNKKYEHISLLHVTHHAIMPVTLWVGLRYYPGGHVTLFGFLNSFVHVVMYLYYLLAAMGPRVRPFLWWKKYLTGFQMVQFTIIFFHAFSVMFIDCNDLPPGVARWQCGLSAMFFILFLDFYIKSYRKKGKIEVKDLKNSMCIPNMSSSSSKRNQEFTNGSPVSSSNGKVALGDTTTIIRSRVPQ